MNRKDMYKEVIRDFPFLKEMDKSNKIINKMVDIRMMWVEGNTK